METIWGLAALAVPAILIGAIVLGRSRPILLMYLAAVVVGLGYLYTTGAVDDVGKRAMDYVATPAAPQPALAPVSEPAPAEATPAAPPAAATETAPAADTPPAGTSPAAP